MQEKVTINYKKTTIDNKMFKTELINRLKRGEEQIKNGEVTDADIVFSEMRRKYRY